MSRKFTVVYEVVDEAAFGKVNPMEAPQFNHDGLKVESCFNGDAVVLLDTLEGIQELLNKLDGAEPEEGDVCMCGHVHLGTDVCFEPDCNCLHFQRRFPKEESEVPSDEVCACGNKNCERKA